MVDDVTKRAKYSPTQCTYNVYCLFRLCRCSFLVNKSRVFYTRESECMHISASCSGWCALYGNREHTAYIRGPAYTEADAERCSFPKPCHLISQQPIQQNSAPTGTWCMPQTQDHTQAQTCRRRLEKIVLVCSRKLPISARAFAGRKSGIIWTDYSVPCWEDG